MSDYNCAAAECTLKKPCEKVQKGQTIDPHAIEHIERNACNYCPIDPPQPVYRTRRVRRRGRYYEERYIASYFDHHGNEWKPDNAVSAWWFHGDPFPGFRDHTNMTFRVVAVGPIRGWQCRYVAGALDDESEYMGTYDYADAGSQDHWDMDVAPHNANAGYTPNLTNQY